MASKLVRLAAAASAYIARRVAAGFGRNRSEPEPSGYKDRLRRHRREAGVGEDPPRPPGSTAAGTSSGSSPSGSGSSSGTASPGTSSVLTPPGAGARPIIAPPVHRGDDMPPPPSLTSNAPAVEDEDDYTPIQLLGRDEGYDEQGWAEFVSKMRQVNSSNVYAYGFQRETVDKGILYVTFLNWTPREFGGDGSREGPGPTYAYYDFPWSKYKAFESAAASSAGGAVWDYCRVRHSAFEHQHTYRLIQTAGDYVPRKATSKGYKAREVAKIGIGKRGGHARQQLAPRKVDFRRVLPAMAYPPDYYAGPNRGKPNRGEPNRGR